MICSASQPVKRIALVIQYLGTHFHGWQRQSNGSSIQQTIEETLAEMCGHPVTLCGAGRTDTGVHAAAQVAHFETNSLVPPERWSRILSARLPQDIVVRQSAAVSAGWHARFSASWRRYRYTIFTAALPNLFVRDYAWHYYYSPLDAAVMQTALSPMLGEQNLAAMQRAGSKRLHAWIDIHEALCWREGDFVYIEVQASGFLYGMMRLLVGLLVEVGRMQLSVAEFTRIWQEQRRDEVRYAAPPHGLCLLGVGYPDDPFSENGRRSPLSLLPKFCFS